MANARPSFSPRNWTGWLLVCLVWFMGRVPFRLGLVLAVPLGNLAKLLMKRRSKIAERNLERCFPEWSQETRDRMVKKHFHCLGRMLFETAWVWTASYRRFARFGQVENIEIAEKAQRSGQGVLIICAHFSALEIGGRLAASSFDDVHGVYRPLRNEVLEWYQTRCRKRHYVDGMIPKKDMRTAIRVLRRGGILWTAPDQDFGLSQSAFAPFFGIRTATLLATIRMARMTGCKVVPLFPRFDPQAGFYRSTFYPALENFPSGDDEADLTRINSLIEEQIRQAPEQYWWIHRRFKTRPPGEPPFYD